MIPENSTLASLHKEQERLEQKYGKKVKLTRWIDCKYCHKNTRPVLDWHEGLIKCGTCDYGLWPLQDKEDCEIYLNCPQFRDKPQWLSLVSIRRRLDRGEGDKELQESYNWFISGNTAEQKARFEKVARFT